MSAGYADWKAFSNAGGVSIPSWPMPPFIPIDLDPPEHKDYRRLFNSALSKEKVERELRPRLAYWTDYYIDQVIERGECDMVYDIALAVPASLTLEWLGWSRPEEQARISAMWHDLTAYPGGHPRQEAAFETFNWFESRIAEELDAREANPRDDLLTQIALYEIDGERIPRERAEGMVRVAVGGGITTTASVMAATIEHFERHPEHRRALEENPDLWDTATEEFLRRYTPNRTNARTVIEDTVWGGCQMRKGDRILLGTSSANLDERQFENPDEVILDRSPNRHVAFGQGFHRCAGIHLARAEFQTVLKILLDRIPEYTVDRERAVRPMAEAVKQGWSSLPVTFPPGERVLSEGRLTAKQA